MTKHCTPFQNRSTRAFHPFWAATLTCLVGASLGLALASAQAPEPAGSGGKARPVQRNGEPTDSETDHRIREGTEIVDQLGYFRMTGDRVTFFSEDGKGRLVGLENLNLERIARTIADNPGQLQWGVTGTITEYRGANYLFVRRAVLRSRVQSSQSVF